MLTTPQIHEIVNSLCMRQADRLFKSGLSVEAFYAQKEEEAVTFEIDCYGAILDDRQKASVVWR